MTEAIVSEEHVNEIEEHAQRVATSIKGLMLDFQKRLQELKALSQQHLAARVALQLKKFEDAGTALCMDQFCKNVSPVSEMQYLFIWGRRRVGSHYDTALEYYRELYRLGPSCFADYRDRYNSKTVVRNDDGTFHFRDATPLEEGTTFFITPTASDLLRKGLLNDERNSIEIPSFTYIP